MSQKNFDIIPISFISGTGGRFISYLLNSAKSNVPVEIKFSKYGNAHDIWNLDIEIGATPYDLTTPLDKHITFFIKELSRKQNNSEFVKNNPVPYYGSCHIDHIEELLFYFDKAVHITYDIEDIPMISYALVGKQMIDQCQHDKLLFLKHFYRSHTTLLKSRLSIRKTRIDLEPNLLNISWKDIVFNDPNLLIEKLSNFSSIAVDKFKMEDLLEWRRRTNICINEIPVLLEI